MLIELPATLTTETLDVASLNDDWYTTDNYRYCQEIGNKWLNDQRFAVLKVPSVIIKKENNYLINPHHPDFKKVVVLNNVFGGFFGSRLMSNIREEKGYTYGIYSYLQNHVQQSAWMISTEAGKEVCEATIDEVYKEMKKLREEPVDEEEILLVKNYMMGGILGDLDGPFHIMAKWKNIILNNLDESYFYESVKAIKEINAEELMELSNKYLHPEKFYELVVY